MKKLIGISGHWLPTIKTHQQGYLRQDVRERGAHQPQPYLEKGGEGKSAHTLVILNIS